MHGILIHAHSGFRWIVLILLVVAIFNAFTKWRSGKSFTEGDRKINLFTMIATHIQLLIGAILYFTSEKVVFSGEAMKSSVNRFFTAEHLLMMLIAIVLITLGNIRSKKAVGDSKKFRIAFTFFLIALLVLLAGIPWPFRDLGTAWF